MTHSVLFKSGRSYFEKILPVDEISFVASFPDFGWPSFMRSYFDPFVLGRPAGGFLLCGFGDPDNFANKHGADAFSVGQRNDATAFGRVLVKIAYGFAVAEYGLDDVESDVRNVILGTEDPAPYIMTSPEIFPPAAPPLWHALTGTTMSTPEGGNSIVVKLRLFARLGAPLYFVKVGVDRSVMIKTVEAERNSDFFIKNDIGTSLSD